MTANVSVVIVNYRTPGLTVRAAESALADPAVAEVIIVDNASGDNSVPHLRAHFAGKPVTVVSAPENLGFGQGNNLGVEATTGDVVLLLNSDAELRASAAGKLAGVLAGDRRVAVVSPTVLLSDGTTPQPDAYGVFPSIRTLVFRTNRRPPDIDQPDWVSGVCLAMRRVDYKAVGGFDPRFRMYLEDVDLCLRVRQHGLLVRRERAAEVIHLGGRSRVSRTRQHEQYRTSLLAFFEHLGWSRLAVRMLGIAWRGWDLSRRVWARTRSRLSGGRR